MKGHSLEFLGLVGSGWEEVGDEFGHHHKDEHQNAGRDKKLGHRVKVRVDLD
jgi:hypothetical protein